MYFRTRCFTKIKLWEINIMYRTNGMFPETYVTARKKLKLYTDAVYFPESTMIRKHLKGHRKRISKTSQTFLRTSCFQGDSRVDFPRRFFFKFNYSESLFIFHLDCKKRYNIRTPVVITGRAKVYLQQFYHRDPRLAGN